MTALSSLIIGGNSAGTDLTEEPVINRKEGVGAWTTAPGGGVSGWRSSTTFHGADRTQGECQVISFFPFSKRRFDCSFARRFICDFRAGREMSVRDAVSIHKPHQSRLHFHLGTRVGACGEKEVLLR